MYPAELQYPAEVQCPAEVRYFPQMSMHCQLGFNAAFKRRQADAKWIDTWRVTTM